MSNTKQNIKHQLVDICHRIYQQGFGAASDGNISVRIDDDRVLITPSGMSKGLVQAEDLILLDAQGTPINKNHKPSSETKLHIGIYHVRPDVQAIVHAHPPCATAFAVAGIELPSDVLPEVVIMVGEIPLIAYSTPGSQQLAESVAGHMQRCDAALMQNHGVITVGDSLLHAYYRMEKVEHYAKILLHAKQLGAVTHLSANAMSDLVQLRKR